MAKYFRKQNVNIKNCKKYFKGGMSLSSEVERALSVSLWRVSWKFLILLWTWPASSGWCWWWLWWWPSDDDDNDHDDDGRCICQVFPDTAVFDWYITLADKHKSVIILLIVIIITATKVIITDKLVVTIVISSYKSPWQHCIVPSSMSSIDSVADMPLDLQAKSHKQRQ